MRDIVKRALALGLSLALSAAGSVQGINSMAYCPVDVKAEVVEPGQKTTSGGIDILEYESNTSAAEFVVNDIAGFEKIAELVNSGREKFTGKTITLNADLKYDKSVENNHDVIGDYDHEFDGIFDGAFHTISGINLNSDLRCVGLFGRTGSNAEISRIILENSSIISQGSPSSDTYFVGGIVSGPCDASINECVSGKDVEITGGSYTETGGIVGDIYANISKCINFSIVKGMSSAGGIVGYAASYASEVKRCINYGAIYNENSDSIHMGGICGSGNTIECCNMGMVLSDVGTSWTPCGIGGISSAGGKAVNCYNRGQIIGADRMYAGGIIAVSSSTIQNCYSVGEVRNGYPGAITSIYADNLCELSNCYWLTGSAPDGVCETGRHGWVSNGPQDTSSVFEYNCTQMTSQGFVNELNANSKSMGYDEVWAADTENINNGYPILKNVPYTIEDLKGSTIYNGFEYKIMETGTIGIIKYHGDDSNIELDVPGQIDGISVTGILEGAFADCSSLTKISVPAGITSIGEGAFTGCGNLTEIRLPNELTSIGDHAFYNCTSLANVYYDGTKEQWTHIQMGSGNDDLQKAAIHFKSDSGDVIEKLYEYQEREDGTIEITKYNGTDTVVDIPAQIDGRRVVSLGNFAFRENEKLTEVHIPSGVIYLEKAVFSGCSSLSSIELPYGLTSIGRFSFSNCISLSSIELPSSLTDIGSSVFGGCTSLESIEIPEGVTSIPGEAFAGCINLSSLKIPVSVTSIEPGTIGTLYEHKLKDIYYAGSKEEWEKIHFDWSLSWNTPFSKITVHYGKESPPNTPEELIPPEILDVKQELERIKSGDPFSLEKDFQQYELSTEQMDTIASCLFTWLAEINYAYQYTGSDTVKQLIMKKAGIDPQGSFADGIEQAVTHICIKTAYGTKTFEITLDLGKPDSSGNLYPAYGAMHYEVLEKDGIPSDVPKEGRIGRESYADMGTFVESVKQASEDSLYGIYQWQRLQDETAAGILIDRTVAEIIGNKNGSFADGTFTIYAEPLYAYSKTVKISCPVDVHVYSMGGEEAGSIVNNQPFGGNRNVRLDVDGDTKKVYLAGDDYYLNLRGTDTGKMKYEVEEIANERVQRTVQFLEIQLEKDLQYEGYVLRPLNIDRHLYALRTIGSSGQEVIYPDKDTYESIFKKVKQLSLNQKSTSLKSDSTVQLHANHQPLDASNPNMRWTVDNESVAKVDANGLVTAVGAGRATVTVATKDGSFLKQFCVIDVSGRKNDVGNVIPSGGSTSGSYFGSSGISGDSAQQPSVVKVHYVLQFDLNGGTKTSRKTMTLLSGDSPGIMPKAQRKGYTFSGWYTQQEGGEKVSGDKPLAAAATLYARWAKASAPEKPASLTLQSKKKGQVLVNFQNVDDAAGYQIAYSTNKSFTNAKTKEAKASAKRKTITSLKAGKKYYLRIRAYSVDSAGNRVYGDYSAVKSVTVKS